MQNLQTLLDNWPIASPPTNTN